MGLPSNVARYDSVDLPEFDLLDLQIVVRPPEAKLTAWTRLEATERGLLAFDWLLHVVRKPGHCTTLVDYLAAAFLLSYESTIQSVKEERFTQGFDAWLQNQAGYTLLCRGLRTLRHLEAHVRPSHLPSQFYRHGYSRFASGADPGQTVAWQLPPISADEFAQLKTPKLSGGELGNWNSLVDGELAVDLMRRGLADLYQIIAAAE